MKKTKTIGIIAVIAVIVFAFTACSLETETKEETVPGKSLADKLRWLSDHRQYTGCYLIELTNSRESIAPETLPYDCSIRMKGVGSSPTVIQLSSSGSLFTVPGSVTLVLDENISLVGRDNNNSALITVEDGGRLIMKQGSKISGNSVSTSGSYSSYSNDSGGVYVRTGGTFTMNGGEISGNSVSASASYGYSSSYACGGGVYNSGTFIMNGGKISGNSASTSGTSSSSEAYGGGVYNSGTFRIVNGTVYGSDAAEGLKNTVTGEDARGAALYKGGTGTAERGTFNGTTWTSNGRLSTTNDTIGVVNGELIEIGSITAPTWHDGNPISLTEPMVTLPDGQWVIEEGWQISDDGDSGWTDFTASTANMSYNGKYLWYYAVISGGQTFYSNVVQITVFPTEREVTIDMYDSGGDGWNGNAALRININGTDATYVRVQTNAADNTPSGQRSSNTFTFVVDAGDVVQLYWAAGSYQYQNSFIAYYTDTPPNPAFTGAYRWGGDNALVYGVRVTMDSISHDTLLGSFIVP